MRATKIKMKPGCQDSSNLLEIEQIYITCCPREGYYYKEDIYDALVRLPGCIQVNIYPFPNLIPAISGKKEKYVRSEQNGSIQDNLLNLPRE